jgi:hypothetical protein
MFSYCVPLHTVAHKELLDARAASTLDIDHSKAGILTLRMEGTWVALILLYLGT